MSRPAERNLAYTLWAEDFVRAGWTPYLLTFMFHPLGGPAPEVARQMEREVERVYATVLPRIVRHPTRPGMVGRLPVWFCALDRPVFKRAKTSLRDVVVNDGLHAHAAAFVPPWSRLPEDLATHFDLECGRYLRPDGGLLRLDAVPITRRVGYVVDYVRKLIGRDVIGEDASFVLPRALSEVRDRAA